MEPTAYTALREKKLVAGGPILAASAAGDDSMADAAQKGVKPVKI